MGVLPWSKKETQDTKNTWTKLLKYGALPVTVATLFLTLISYGFILGYLDRFDLKPQELHLSAIDYLQRSYLPMITWAEFLGKLFSWQSLHIATEKYILELGTGVLVLSGLVAFAVWLKGYLSSPTKSRVDALLNRLSTRTAIKTVVNWVMPRGRSAVQLITHDSTKWLTRRRLMGFGSLFIPVLGWLLLPLVLVIAWLIGYAVLLFVSLIPVLGVKAGFNQATEAVIEPKQCRVMKHGTVQPVSGARCVAVLKDQQEIARGRYIDESADRIFLYRKATGTIVSAPLKDSVIVDTEHD